KQTLDYYAGKNDAKYLTDFQTGQTRQEAILPAARKVGGATRAVAAATLARLQMSGASLRPTTDLKQTISLVEEAHAAAPSDATHAMRITALVLRTHETLGKQEPAYTELATQTKRTLNGAYLVAIVLGRDG